MGFNTLRNFGDKTGGQCVVGKIQHFLFLLPGSSDQWCPTVHVASANFAPSFAMDQPLHGVVIFAETKHTGQKVKNSSKRFRGFSVRLKNTFCKSFHHIQLYLVSDSG